jgi:hypothetical protein
MAWLNMGGCEDDVDVVVLEDAEEVASGGT